MSDGSALPSGPRTGEHVSWQQVTVIGAGLGGVPCAYELRKRLGKPHRVTLIGASPYFEFTPSNPWIAVGWRKREQTRVLCASPLARQGHRMARPSPVVAHRRRGQHA